MKRKLLFFIIFLCLVSCSADKQRCWTIYINAFGLTEQRLFWGTADDVALEAKMLREASENSGVSANIYFEPSDYVKASCR